MNQPTAPLRASLFITCIIDHLYPQVGVSVVRTLRRHGVRLNFPPGQTCCGQPLYNAGFAAQARRLAARVLDAFDEHDHDHDRSDYVIVPSGSCGAMLRVFYLDLFAHDPPMLARAAALSRRVYEFTEFLADIAGAGEAAPTATGSPGSTVSASGPAASVAYHPSCHLLREMGVVDAPRRLLDAAGIPLTELPDAEQCCGFGGAFAVKYPHISEAMLADKIDAIRHSGADTLTACDMGCLMHLAGGITRQQRPVRVQHIAQLLDQAAA